MDARCEITIDSSVQVPLCVPLKVFWPFAEIMEQIEQLEATVLEKSLYHHFYKSFCDYHNVSQRQRHGFQSFDSLNKDFLSRRSELSKTELRYFVNRAVMCRYSVEQEHPSMHCSGVEPSVGILLGLLWPHTFFVKGSNIGSTGKYVNTPVHGFEVMPPALPSNFIELEKERTIEENMDNTKKEETMRAARLRLRNTKEQRFAFFRKVIDDALPTPVPSDLFSNDAYRDARIKIDISIMELFRDRHNELCPCCYLSLQRGKEYVRYANREQKVCHSHIFSEHYLDAIGVDIAVDMRQNTKVITAVGNMRMDLLCWKCDNTQGTWEGLIRSRMPCCTNSEKNVCEVGPCFVEPSVAHWTHLFNHACLSDGSAVGMQLESERSFFRFLVPNIYRACLLGVNNCDNLFVSYCDVLRQYMHVHLDKLFPERPPTVIQPTPSFRIYVFTISTSIFKGLVWRWKSAFPDSDFRDALQLGIDCAAMEGNTAIGVVMNPFIICMSTQDIPAFAPFLLEDLVQYKYLVFPHAEHAEVLDFVSIILHNALEKDRRSVNSHTHKLEMELQRIMKERQQDVELPVPFRYTALVCGYINSREITYVMSAECHCFFKWGLSIFESLGVGRERSELLQLINTLDTYELREMSVSFLLFAKDEFAELLDLYDSL